MIPEILAGPVRKLTEGLTWKKILCIVLGAAITTFGIHNIHQQVGITEGGIMGLMLLLHHWFGLSPALLTPLLDALCYLLAFRCLGGQFLKISVLSTGSVAPLTALTSGFLLAGRKGTAEAGLTPPPRPDGAALRSESGQ